MKSLMATLSYPAVARAERLLQWRLTRITTIDDLNLASGQHEVYLFLTHQTHP